MSFFERSRFSQRGKRFLKLIRGKSSALAAFSLNLAPKKALFSRVRRSSLSRFSGVTSENKSPAGKIVGKHEEKTIVVLDYFEMVAVLFFPRGPECQT